MSKQSYSISIYKLMMPSGNNARSRAYIPVIINDRSVYFKKIASFANAQGAIWYSSILYKTYLKINFNPSSTSGVKKSTIEQTQSTRKIKLLISVDPKDAKVGEQFTHYLRVPKDHVTFADSTIMVKFAKLSSKANSPKDDSGIKDDAPVANTVNEISKRVIEELKPSIQQSAKEIISGLINSDEFITKLANTITFKQSPLLTTKLNRVQEQNSASNKQLKEELSKEFSQAIKQLIDYWNK